MQTAKLTNLTAERTAQLTVEQVMRIKLIQDTIAEHSVSAKEQAQLDQFIQWILERNCANS